MVPNFGESVYNSHNDDYLFNPELQNDYGYGNYEIDVQIERHTTYVNDMPAPHNTSTSQFTAFAPPQLGAPLPLFEGGEFFGDDLFLHGNYAPLNQVVVDPSLDKSYSLLQSNIAVSEHEQPLLEHFIHNVLPQIYPIQEAYGKGGLRAQAVLSALETNKCYLHCCLSVASIHLKTTEGFVGEQIDNDIMRHRYEAISQLCQALGEDEKLQEILDATLAMIFFHCAVGTGDNDVLPDIHWSDHFQAASNLIIKLGLPNAVAQETNGSTCPFSMSMASWIDILGATMVGKTPQFAHEYRSKYLGQTMSGLRELMGCDDKIMYLISEIACLDSLKAEGRISSMDVCCHVQLLGQQLESTEPHDATLESPYDHETKALRPEILTKTISHIFRLAARIYLRSLVPNFDRTEESNEMLVAEVTDALQFIPAGPYGYDRSLVWPLLMTGVFSSPTSPFRAVLASRTEALGVQGSLGSFGRMYRLLQEVWQTSGDSSIGFSQVSPEVGSYKSLTGSSLKRESSEPSLGADTMIMKQPVHWRYIMGKNNWNHLLI